MPSGFPAVKYGYAYDSSLLVPDPDRRWSHVLYPPTGEVFHVDEATYEAVCEAHPYPDGPRPYKPAAITMQERTRRIRELTEDAALSAARKESGLSDDSDGEEEAAPADDPQIAEMSQQLEEALALIQQQADLIDQLSTQMATAKKKSKPSEPLAAPGTPPAPAVTEPDPHAGQ